MIRTTSRTAFLAMLLVSGAIAPAAQAALVSVNFAGTLASAENNTYDDPSIPQGNFFFVGQAFSGSVSYDTSLPADDSEPDFTTFPLLGFNITIGGSDFSDRFIPRLIGRESDGSVEFLTGGASQGGSASLSLNIPGPADQYPTASQLNGRYATFSYQDFTPLGGSLSGRALIGSVPEPASWALMIGGFGLVGGAMRRRSTPARIRVTFG